MYGCIDAFIQLVCEALLTVDTSRGRGRAEESTNVLAELFRKDRHTHLGSRCYGPRPNGGLSGGVKGFVTGRGEYLPTLHYFPPQGYYTNSSEHLQRLLGASLLVFKNKSDIAGSMSESEVCKVRVQACLRSISLISLLDKPLRTVSYVKLKPFKEKF